MGGCYGSPLQHAVEAALQCLSCRWLCSAAQGTNPLLTPLSAEPKTVKYKSPFSQSTFLLNTSVADVYSHEAGCAAQGGHLTSYISLLEQLEVEDQFVNLGVLLPTFHLRYWIGLYIPYRDPKLWPGGLAG